MLVIAVSFSIIAIRQLLEVIKTTRKTQDLKSLPLSS
jgi:hypothetical protein